MTRFSCHAAPALFFAYGLVRLLDGRDGDRGPGPAWTLGHLFFLAGLLLFGVVLVGLRRALSEVGGWRRYAATTVTVLGVIGLLAFIRVAIIDIVVGLRAADHPGMGELFQRYENAPWGVVPAAVGEVVPVFFVVGMVALVTLLAVGSAPVASRLEPGAGAMRIRDHDGQPGPVLDRRRAALAGAGSAGPAALDSEPAALVTATTAVLKR